MDGHIEKVGNNINELIREGCEYSIPGMLKELIREGLCSNDGVKNDKKQGEWQWKRLGNKQS